LADRLQMGDTFLRDTIEQGKVLYERPGEWMEGYGLLDAWIITFHASRQADFSFPSNLLQ
jgi:hypothetical protein